MRALTLHPPWASLVAEGVKTIETRSWRAPASLIGERFAVHAAVRMPNIDDGSVVPCQVTAAIERVLHARGECIGDGLPLGAVVATARLVDCVPMVDVVGAENEMGAYVEVAAAYLALWRPGADVARRIDDQRPFGDFAPGRWAWLLDGIEKLPEPVPARGRQRLWNWQCEVPA